MLILITPFDKLRVRGIITPTSHPKLVVGCLVLILMHPSTSSGLGVYHPHISSRPVEGCSVLILIIPFDSAQGDNFPSTSIPALFPLIFTPKKLTCQYLKIIAVKALCDFYLIWRLFNFNNGGTLKLQNTVTVCYYIHRNF